MLDILKVPISQEIDIRDTNLRYGRCHVLHRDDSSFRSSLSEEIDVRCSDDQHHQSEGAKEEQEKDLEGGKECM